MERERAVGDARERVERAVARAVGARALWPVGATLIAAVSGGADSLCLLGALVALGERGDPLAPGEIVVAHLDHGLRGGAGAADARFVAELAARLGLRCVAERADVAALARAERRSPEDAARRARYAFLRRVAREAGGEAGSARIATGHTRDDQAETLVLHWLRGSGLAGLVGMAPLAGDLARPLLEVTRAETEAYCAARGWEPREDASNADPRFMRNRIRRELLPLLEGYNPGLRDALIRNAALLAEDERYLESQTDAAWAETAREATEARVALDLAALRARPAALRHRLFRRAAARLLGPERGLEARHIAALDDLLARGRTGGALDLPGGVRAALGYAALAFERPAGRRPSPDGAPAGDDEWALPVPGAVDLPRLGWRVRAMVMERPAGLERDDPPLAPAYLRVGNAADVDRAEMRVYLDADTAGDALRVRTWRPGDRFRPLGMTREKKLQDYFADAKVPRALRHRLPLVFGAGHLLWVGGDRIDDRARITPATRRTLVLQMEPLGGPGASAEGDVRTGDRAGSGRGAPAEPPPPPRPGGAWRGRARIPHNLGAGGPVESVDARGGDETCRARSIRRTCTMTSRRS